MKRYTAGFSLLCLLFGIILLSCGCSRSFSLTVRMGSYPDSLDPQIASSRLQLTVAQNAFEGLMRLDENGTPVVGAAESYTVSADGLKYTFTLRDGLKWSNGDEMTVDDFIFGLERATLASTKAEYGYLLKHIEGAEARLSGKESTSLGAFSEGSDRLVIILSEPDGGFLHALCHPVASPCSRSYFTDCGGKYGIGAKLIISNGPYKISYTAENERIRIAQNVNYGGDRSTLCGSIDFSFKAISANKDITELLASGDCDIAEADTAEVQRGVSSGLGSLEYRDSVYYLLFNPSSQIFAKRDIRSSFIMSSSLGQDGDAVTSAELLPADVTLLKHPLSGVTGIKKINYYNDPTTACSLFLSASDEALRELINGSRLLTDDSSEITDSVKSMASSWQKELGAFVNINTVAAETAAYRVRNGSYTAAVVRITSPDLSAEAFVNELYTALGSPKALRSAVTSVERASSLEQAVAAINSFVSLLEENCYAVPVTSIPNYYLFSGKYSGLQINSYGCIDFSLIRK